jgi:maleamate amidohydrolase
MTALDEDYARAGFSGHLPFGARPALLIVDVCNAYLDPASPLYAGVEAALDSNVVLAAAARAAGIPVVFTRVAYTSGGLDGGLFYRKVPALAAYLDNNPLGDFHDRLRPEPGDLVVTKQYASAFFGSSLAASLTAMARDCLLITGFSTSGCVRATALDALQHGFIPYVVRDACGDRAPGPHEANLFDLQAKYAEVVDQPTALALIAG